MSMTQPTVHTEVIGAIKLHGDQQLQLRSRKLGDLAPMAELSQYNPAVGNLLACPFPDDPQILRKLAHLFLDRAEKLEHA